MFRSVRMQPQKGMWWLHVLIRDVDDQCRGWVCIVQGCNIHIEVNASMDQNKKIWAPKVGMIIPDLYVP